MRQLSLLFALFLFVFSAKANPILPLQSSEIDKLIAVYKYLHQHPEVSLNEKQTASTLAEKMRGLGFTVTENFGGYGIVCEYKNGDGPTVLYRTDLDALPMEEKTELAYASTVKHQKDGMETGVMHSCGHDMHMTSWLGTAQAMIKNKNSWKGRLLFIGQPAEEIGAGAKMMLDAGLYEKFGVPDYGFALHCSPIIECGKIGLSAGFTMANTESITIEVFGQGAHGASPHMSLDPVVLASMMVVELQTITSRSLKPTEAAVVTVGAFNGGTVSNIIPDKVTLKLTVRTYKDEVRAMVHKRIKEIARGTAIAAGLPERLMPKVHIPDAYTPANFNNEKLVNHIQTSAKKVIGDDQVIYAEPLMLGEDFARFGRTEHNVPTVLYWLGTAPKERLASDDIPGLHSPYYYPELRKTLTTAISVNSKLLIDLMK